VLGGLVIAGMVTPVVGLPIGGALVGAWGWRAAFFVNVPIALITLVMAWIWIPRDPAADAATPRSFSEVAKRLDAAGIAAFGATMAVALVLTVADKRLMSSKKAGSPS
jgi:predicted MFS family arabinose efflux permease